MPELSSLARPLILVGLLLVGAGVGLWWLSNVPGRPERISEWFGWLGRLPGDISIKRENGAFYFPLTTSLLISAVLSLVWYLFALLGRR